MRDYTATAKWVTVPTSGQRATYQSPSLRMWRGVGLAGRLEERELWGPGWVESADDDEWIGRFEVVS